MTIREQIAKELWEMWKFREEATNDKIYAIRDAKLNGAVSLTEKIGFKVYFNPLFKGNEKPFIVEDVR